MLRLRSGGCWCGSTFEAAAAAAAAASAMAVSYVLEGWVRVGAWDGFRLLASWFDRCIAAGRRASLMIDAVGYNDDDE